MTSIVSAPGAEADTSRAARDAEGTVGTISWGPISLRRDGLPPLRFSGYLIARYDGRVRHVPLWHDIALYRTQDGFYVTHLIVNFTLTSEDSVSPEHGRANLAARCHAVAFQSLEEAVCSLEGHDASHDICPGLSAPALVVDNVVLSPAALAMQAMILRGFCQDAVIRYRIGVGALLAGIGLREI
jgi:hypothetical protein